MGKGRGGKSKNRAKKERKPDSTADHLNIGAGDTANYSDAVNTNLVLRPATEFPVQYRRNRKLKKEEQDKIQKAVENGGVACGPQTYIDMGVLTILLDTDKPGVAIVVDNAPKEDIIEIADKTYLSTPEIVKEQTKRMEQPRPALQREKLQQARDNVEDFSNNPTLKEERAIESDRIREDRPKIGKRAIKAKKAKESELSGEPLTEPEAHHLDRVADKPEKARDLDNLTILNREEHRKFHTSEYTQNRKGFEQFAEEFKKQQKQNNEKRD